MSDTPYDFEEEDDGAGETDIIRDADGENADLCIDPDVIQAFSDWTDPESPPPWEAEGFSA